MALALAAVVLAGLGKGKGVAEAGMTNAEVHSMERVGARVKARVMAPEGWANACGKNSSECPKLHTCTKTSQIFNRMPISQRSNGSIALLFTTFNDVRQRNEMYVPRLQWWIDNTRFHIFITEASNNRFKGLHLRDGTRPKTRILHFNQTLMTKEEKELYNARGGRPDSSTYEFISLMRIARKYRSELEKFEYVVKITGKYVLPTLATELDKVLHGKEFPDILLQSECSWQPNDCHGSELFAIKGNLIIKFLSFLRTKLLNGGHMENAIHSVKMGSQFSTQVLPMLPIPCEWRTNRGNGSILPHVHRTRSNSAKSSKHTRSHLKAQSSR